MAANLRTRLIHGVGANALGQGVNVLIQLVGLPVYLAVWGVERYGEWLVLSSLAAFLSMSDIGFASAAANDMTMRVGRDDRDGALVVFQSMWALLCGLGGLVLAVLLAVLWLTPAVEWLPLKVTPPATAAAVLSALAVYMLIGQQIAVVQAGFRCNGNYALGQALVSGTRLAEFIAQVLVAIVTASMLWVAVAGLVVRCLALVALEVILLRFSPWLRLRFAEADRDTIRHLAGPAIAFMGMPLGNALNNQGIIQVVAAVLGPAAVVVFATHRTVTNVAVQMMSMINHSVWPEFSTAYGAGDIPLMRRLHRKACQFTIWLACASCILLAASAPFIFPIWTHGKVLLDSWLFGILLAVVVLRSGWLTSLFVPLAINEHSRIAVTYVIAMGSACGAAIAFAERFGLIGAALCLVLAEASMTAIVLRTALATVNDSLSGFLRAISRPPIRELANTIPNRYRPTV